MSWFVPLLSSVLAFQVATPPSPPAAPTRVAPAMHPAGAGGVTHHIVIDSDLEDWKDIPAAIVDPADAPDAFVDLGEVRVDHDGQFVYLLIDFGKTVNAQGLDGTASILFDSDGDPATGETVNGLPGVDFIVDLSPTSGKSYDKSGVGLGIRTMTQMKATTAPAASQPALNIYDVDLILAPTYAVRRMEFRISRGKQLPGIAPLFTGASLTGKVVFADLKGELADETGTISHDLTPIAPPPAAEDSRDPLQRPAGTDIRVMSWNAELGAIISRPEPFVRSLQALAPDVILLQELTNKNSAEQLQTLLNGALPPEAGSAWHVAFGTGGGDLRCAVASRFPLHDVDGLTVIPSPNQPKRNMRAIGVRIEQGDHAMLVTSIHLKCCGRAGGREDEQREAEVTAIHDAIKSAEQAGIAGIIIAGDFNLVGERTPLEMMLSGLDVDGTPLGLTAPYQLDGLSNATWFDRHQPFAPGRLDYMLYADSGMMALRSFVYDSRDLSAAWRAKYAVNELDSEEASDHLPVVTDFRWIDRNAAQPVNPH